MRNFYVMSALPPKADMCSAKSGHRTLYSITSSARTNKSEKLRGPLNLLEIGILEIGVLFLRLIPR
jgi:hypothetical protein